MPLRHEPDVSVAAWFTRRDEPWTRLCSFGPSGFAAYAQLPHAVLDRDHEDQQLSLLVSVLADHTTTSEDCFFGLWDGYGDVHGSPSTSVVVSVYGGDPAQRTPPPQIPPAFPPEVLSTPRVSIPNRDYLLFRGPLSLAGDWGAAELLPGHPRRLNGPNLIWPADRSWFVAADVDLAWTGIGGSADLVSDLLARDGLGCARVEPTDRPT